MSIVEDRATAVGGADRVGGGVWEHSDFIGEIVDLVGRYGTSYALGLVLSDPRGVPVAGGRRHHTLAAYFVWAVAWLLDAGIEPADARRHPLVAPSSPSAWYDTETLASARAHQGFVAAPVFGPGAPTPIDVSIVAWLDEAVVPIS